MKKLSLLTLLFSLLIQSNAQKVLFSTSFGNYTLAPVIKYVSNTQYVGYIWYSSNGTFYDPYLFFLDRKGQKTQDNIPFSSSYVLSTGFINSYRSGFLVENYEAPSGYSNRRVLTYLDASGKSIWKHEFDSVQTYYAYGPSLVIEPDKRLRLILADTNGHIAFHTLDSNGIELSIINIKGNIPSPIAFNLIRIADNRYLFATIDNMVPHSYSNILCTDSSGVVLWELPFNTDLIKIGLIEHIILLNNSIYVKAWNWDSVSSAYSYSLFKVDLNGTILLRKDLSFTFTPLSYISSLTHSKDGAFYLFFNKTDGSSNISQVCKYDQELNQRWCMHFNDFTYSIDTSSCNGYVRTYSSSHQTSGVDAYVDPDLEDICDKCETTVYPNPSTQDFFNIRSVHPEVFIQSTEMYDMGGRLVWKNNIAIDNPDFPVNHNLSDGIYLCKIGCENGKSQLKRVVIAK